MGQRFSLPPEAGGITRQGATFCTRQRDGGLPSSSLHERKALMADLSDAFVALPSGFGTREEFCEVLTWTQLGLHGAVCSCGGWSNTGRPRTGTY